MPELVVKLGDTVVQRYIVEKDIISIGRAKDNDIVIENLSVSRNHARIRRQGNAYVLTDLNSANGTFVNNVRITKTEILDGDVITIGKHQILFINKDLSESDVIVEALAADRTMVIDRAEKVGILCCTEGKLKGKTFALTKAETTIGKSPHCDIVIADDWFLAKKQAIISRHGTEYEIRDLGTIRRTRVNGKPISGAQRLAEGDTIEISSERLLFKLADASQFETPAGRVPKELGLDDSIFASVSELPAELQPIEEADLAAAARPTSLEESEDWSGAAEKLAEEAAAQVPSAISMEDLEAALVSQTFGQAEVEAAAAAPGSEEPPQTSEESARLAAQEAKNARLSRKKQRELQRAAKAAGRVETPPSAATPQRTEGEAPQTEAAAEAKAEPEAVGASSAQSEALDAASEEAVAKQTGQALEVQAKGLTVEEQIALWESALKNKSPVIRRQAARMLKKLTGKDYAY
jgi:pSer/pThr/pTyr-binding forkhead associated (FHA) protein